METGGVIHRSVWGDRPPESEGRIGLETSICQCFQPRKLSYAHLELLKGANHDISGSGQERQTESTL
jgi:hypothetical protein